MNTKRRFFCVIHLKEVIELCLEEMDPDEKKNLPEFVGIQQIEVAV